MLKLSFRRAPSKTPFECGCAGLEGWGGAGQFDLWAGVWDGPDLQQEGRAQLRINQTRGRTQRFRLALTRPTELLSMGQTGPL